MLLFTSSDSCLIWVATLPLGTVHYLFIIFLPVFVLIQSHPIHHFVAFSCIALSVLPEWLLLFACLCFTVWVLLWLSSTLLHLLQFFCYPPFRLIGWGSCCHCVFVSFSLTLSSCASASVLGPSFRGFRLTIVGVFPECFFPLVFVPDCAS